MNVKDRFTIPFGLIKERTSKIQRMEEINIVMRGGSFDFSKLDSLEGPTYLVNFNSPIKTRKEVIYVEQYIKYAYVFLQLGLKSCYVEQHRMLENGQTIISKSYPNFKWYETIMDNPDFQRIAIYEQIRRPIKQLTFPKTWVPSGAGLSAVCALYYFADKINIYGWDFYFRKSPNAMSYWELFSNLNNFKLDMFRSRLHFECTLTNLYYGYHLSQLPNIKNYGYMGQLSRHEKMIKKIERVLFNNEHT